MRSLYFKKADFARILFRTGMAFAILVFLPSCAEKNRKQVSPLEASEGNRQFIAHRGVHLRYTIAGENSLKAVELAKKAGFDAVETDVRLTADSQLVVIHDLSLNRTCLYADGTELQDELFVADYSLKELRKKFRLKASEKQDQTVIPTLKEFLLACKQWEILPFIEPKIYDASGEHYREICELADSIMGKNQYIITSNNRANKVIRERGWNDIPLMGILYQTTFEEIENLGNCIMAINATRFNEEEYSIAVSRAKERGLETESHADKFKQFSLINDHAIDYISTDFLAPDLKEGVLIRCELNKKEDFAYSGKWAKDGLFLPEGEILSLKHPLPETSFGGVFLEIEIVGSCLVELAYQRFEIESPNVKKFKYQLMLYNTSSGFELTAKDAGCTIKGINMKLCDY